MNYTPISSFDERRADRWRTNFFAKITCAKGSLKPVSIVELSATGFRICDGKLMLCPKEVISVEINGLTDLNAVICWHYGAFFGCKFFKPLHIAVAAQLRKQTERIDWINITSQKSHPRAWIKDFEGSEASSR